MNALDFTGKQIWVTGAARGIGAEVARQCVALGASVVGFDRTFPESELPYRCIELDVSDQVRVQQVTKELLAQCPNVDILINAAGILRMASFAETSWQDLNDCFSVNTGGAFNMMQALFQQFTAQGSGAIVNVSSNAAKVPRINMAAYCASKAALSALSHSAALELSQYGVRCNVVCPGSTDTPMQRMLWQHDDARERTIAGFPEQYKLGIPLGRIAEPSDVAQAILFFASDMSRHITMQDIVVDGGATLNA
ncbi:2,3-dihydro-2,3-dihydroxybenzoate dehydrogenase [Marinomonas ostreistagni]|uniref:2,3-dihydro-2,3-dihydroxybenzoate dehydrogenase n=1 Tax=Marinomonas ostreistagni TaxID=359209 RepID=UPI0019503259|nr:2,3-dihydro-2,3-dihydroxybenzoate dehydrogenase [Marinomonas ostreistagni]MBM6549492.1 2,3-dihydro-2,3-dihydroxybenzoate dehydrogenase [Marinomonas ostreistagni]